MRFGEAGFEIPTWILGAVLILFVASFAYGLLVMRSIIAPVAVWVGLLGVALILFVVYLLFRLVVAVEKIADTR